MAQTAGNVRLDKPFSAGSVWRAPLGTTLPTDPSGDLDDAFACVGYLMKGGITRAHGRTMTDIEAYGGDIVATAESADKATVQFVMIETNEASLGVYYNTGNVSSADGVTTVRGNSQEFDHAVTVVRTVARGANRLVVYPDSQISDRGDVVHQDEDATAYDVTLTAYPSDDIGGDKYREYIEESSAAGVPHLSLVNPGTSPTAGGKLNRVTGSGFLGTTGVKVGGTTVTDFIIESDTAISFVAPANTSGNKAIVVTNATGASTDVLNVVYS